MQDLMNIKVDTSNPNPLNFNAWRPHMCQFFREAVLRMSRAELAKKIGVSGAIIGKWEDIKSKSAPNEPNLEKLCQAFGCEIFELYSDFDPAHTREFLEDIFKTWSFVLQQAIRSDIVSEKKLALSLTQLFMDYDERRRTWEAQDPRSKESDVVQSGIDEIMFKEKPTTDSDTDESDVEEGGEIDAIAPPVERQV